jgi:hypothetical protein
MIEIKNITRGPVQLSIRTRAGKGLTVKNIPGIGAGKNIYMLADERHTDYVDRAEKQGLITQRRISTKASKGDK